MRVNVWITLTLAALLSGTLLAQSVRGGDKSEHIPDRCPKDCREICGGDQKCERLCRDLCVAIRDVIVPSGCTLEPQVCTQVGPFGYCVTGTGSFSLSISGGLGVSFGLDTEGHYEGCVSSGGGLGVGVLATASGGRCIGSQGPSSVTAVGLGYGVELGNLRASKTFEVSRKCRNAEGISGTKPGTSGRAVGISAK